MGNAPLGVTVVAVLTMLGAGGDFMFAALWAAFGGMGSAGYYHDPPTSYWIVLISSLLLSLISIVASIGMLLGARRIWYLSIFVWVFSAVHYCYAFSLTLRGESLNAAAGLAILVNAIFIVYFQSKQVKGHFLKHSSG